MTTQPQLLQIALDKQDVVYTPDWVACDMVEFFKPSGRILEPCAGDGAFLKYLPNADWCEIEKGRDFFACHEFYDWIIGNPPYKQYSKWMQHSFEISKNVVYFVPLNKLCNGLAQMKRAYRYGGCVSMRVYGQGKTDEIDFSIGFAMGALHYQRDYRGPMYTSFYEVDYKPPSATPRSPY